MPRDLKLAREAPAGMIDRGPHTNGSRFVCEKCLGTGFDSRAGTCQYCGCKTGILMRKRGDWDSLIGKQIEGDV